MIGNTAPTQAMTMAELTYLPLVLVVDDDPRARKLVGIVLEHAGYRVATAEDGPSALVAFGEVSPDAIVADLMMPGMNGIELLGQVRQRAAGAVPVLLLLTAMDTSDTRAAARAAGIDEVMTKPFNRDVFLRRIEELLAARTKG